MPFDQIVEAAQSFIATATQREFVSIVVSFVTALVSLTAAFLGWLSTRELKAEVHATRKDLHREQAVAIRLEAQVAEQRKALDRREQELDARSELVVRQEENRRNLIKILQQSDEDLWVRHGKKIKPFDDYDARIARRQPIVLLVANNKGGVGKSTLILNIAAHFDRHPLVPGKKRLLIDMDYQASSSYILTALIGLIARESRSQLLMTHGVNETTLFNARVGLGSVMPGTELVPSFYELARHEERLLFEWLLGEVDDDLRYRLASLLLGGSIAKQYDLILIDAPPRLTTGTINALCACTHLLVPTAFTAIAAEPVGNFLAMAKAVKNELNPNLKMIGVVETLTPAGNVGRDAQDARARARLTVERALRNNFPDASIFQRDVPRNNSLIEEGIAYQEDNAIRAIFEQLCEQIKAEST